jgi:methylated-DNA-[protein]-cysteine S-methyltransferase
VISLEGSPVFQRIFYYPSPVGTLRGVISSKGLVSLSLDRGQFGVKPEQNMGIDITDRYYHDLIEQLNRYFRSDLDTFSIDLDTTGISDFRLKVYRKLKTIPFGSLITYGDLGEQAGIAGAGRAVGGAMRRNPYLMVVPCHRVVSAKSHGRYGIGGFSAGLEVKRHLLSFEGSIRDITKDRSPYI